MLSCGLIYNKKSSIPNYELSTYNFYRNSCAPPVLIYNSSSYVSGSYVYINPYHYTCKTTSKDITHLNPVANEITLSGTFKRYNKINFYVDDNGDFIFSSSRLGGGFTYQYDYAHIKPYLNDVAQSEFDLYGSNPGYNFNHSDGQILKLEMYAVRGSLTSKTVTYQITKTDQGDGTYLVDVQCISLIPVLNSTSVGKCTNPTLSFQYLRNNRIVRMCVATTNPNEILLKFKFSSDNDWREVLISAYSQNNTIPTYYNQYSQTQDLGLNNYYFDINTENHQGETLIFQAKYLDDEANESDWVESSPITIPTFQNTLLPVDFETELELELIRYPAYSWDIFYTNSGTQLSTGLGYLCIKDQNIIIENNQAFECIIGAETWNDFCKNVARLRKFFYPNDNYSFTKVQTGTNITLSIYNNVYNALVDLSSSLTGLQINAMNLSYQTYTFTISSSAIFNISTINSDSNLNYDLFNNLCLAYRRIIEIKKLFEFQQSTGYNYCYNYLSDLMASSYAGKLQVIINGNVETVDI